MFCFEKYSFYMKMHQKLYTDTENRARFVVQIVIWYLGLVSVEAKYDNSTKLKVKVFPV